MYSLQQYGHMIRDTVRITAYEQALRRAIKPGDVVVDVGAGTGIFALMACQYGARHVYAIEPNPLIDLGPAMAAANGFGDRMTFIRGMSSQVELPERADVMIGDLRGRLPPFQLMVDAFVDARARYLKPGALVIPQRDTVYAALVGAPDTYTNEILKPWVQNLAGVKMDTVMSIIRNSVLPDPIDHPQALLTPQVFATLDYDAGTLAFAPQPMRWEVTQPETLHFVALWFDAVLFEDIGFSNAPGAKSPQVYQRLLLPFQAPLALAAGEIVSLTLTVSPALSNDHTYVWQTQVFANAEASKPRIDFKQSTLFATPLTGVRKRSANFVPTVKIEGKAVARALVLMQDGTALSSVAGNIAAEFPALFRDPAEALSFVASLSQQYSS